ncbi:LysR family transcriptional regulator [Litorilituus lipolyticus]|uniref:LysR family transcriptional regulator n=1 Tax=Litorilituus lipolyticus TaxID=2491017 RepID=A0A502KXZ9_9GAMM|nr:LysR family transcriptional regulator [Litorilituus lipolyticus]TPH15025.1 LysR family transcriptional regulator [Litorilituus lipolyticus]
MNNIANIDDLRLFVVLVEEGSFTSAAKKLNIAKSKLSRRLMQLEQKLGCELLIRTTRSQQLTETGRLLFCESRQHIEALSQVEERLALTHNELQGQINISLPLEFFNRAISHIIADFLQQHPKIAVTCHHYSGSMPAFDPHYDLSFVLHEQTLPASNWIARELASFPQAIYISKQYYEQIFPADHDANSLTIDTLATIECVLAEQNEPWFFRQGEMEHVFYVKGRAVLSSPEMRLQACQQGLGVCKLPKYVINNQAKQQNISMLDMVCPPVAQRLSVLYQSRNIAVKTRTFLDFFQSRIGQLL